MQPDIPLLQQTILFSGIEAEELRHLLTCLGGSVRHYGRGEFLWHAGDTVLQAGIVLQGAVDAVQYREDGAMQLVARHTAGGVFGEMLMAAGEASPVSVLVGGLWCGLTVALVSPFFAFLLGIGPAFLPIVPMVAVGNMVLVVILHLLASRDKIATRSYLAVVVGAVTKFLALWLLIVKLVLPTLGLAEKQVAAISASFSWPQLVTAAIGGVLAVTIAPLIRKALRSK